eukprot:GHUV01003085.1.p1 GENE.GHUV01003085.1~~GHUV01003085.1.p1  ORF type:complete len:246 (+),score=79.06 GHUV01003085.1:184-921(+)
MPKLYGDLMSQPMRACYILCKANNLPVDIQLIRVDRMDHKKQDYLKINPLGKVPFLTDGDLQLPESVAIMSYLADLYHIPQHWHPTSSSSSATLKDKAMYMAAAHWYHSTIRLGCMKLVFHTVIGPRVFKVPGVKEVAADGHKVLQQALKDLEGYWLRDKPFMTGQQVAIPDLLCCCELEQMKMMVAEPSAPQFEQLLAPYPKIRSWMPAVRQAVGPGVYDEAHGKLMASVERLAAAAKSDRARL